MSETVGKKILVVDDEEDVLIQVQRILEYAHYKVIGTTRGKEAVPLAKKEKPDLIILDILIPDMLGGEISRLLSEDPQTQDIPIIFLTGLNTKEDENIIKEVTGEYRLLAKPVTREGLLEAVARIFTTQ